LIGSKNKSWTALSIAFIMSDAYTALSKIQNCKKDDKLGAGVLMKKVGTVFVSLKVSIPFANHPSQ
jgi:hypothetical protein